MDRCRKRLDSDPGPSGEAEHPADKRPCTVEPSTSAAVEVEAAAAALVAGHAWSRKAGGCGEGCGRSRRARGLAAEGLAAATESRRQRRRRQGRRRWRREEDRGKEEGSMVNTEKNCAAELLFCFHVTLLVPGGMALLLWSIILAIIVCSVVIQFLTL
ncbi:hypothetical protein GUJ93_ZPchr0009g856 [Zizania palustris]|uniref:Uncharacterized protein n=1 Tax=Zizania palustris TaxID=103762 RepID=A0A8J5RJW2_ZIZPA|nr:hypothetical protein GUJ93_ZPchr0009g856 [Zizania palustris]